MSDSATGERLRVWDLPTRISHWTTVILFGACWWTAETGHMRWHLLAGYGVFGVVLFRIAWGLCGGQTARFSDFVRGPAATFRYVRELLARHRCGSSPPGHNPLGALSILVMLALLVTQALFGAFAVDVDGVSSGPFSRFVSFETGRLFAHLHAANFNLLLAMIGVHLTAIGFYGVVRKENLVAPMIHGYKSRMPSGEAPYFVPAWRAVLLAAGIFTCLAVLLRVA